MSATPPAAAARSAVRADAGAAPSAERYLDLVELEAHRFAEVARGLAPTARSRSYPGFDVETLTVHVGATLVTGAHVVRTGDLLQDAARRVPPPHRPAADWLEDAAADFVSAARGADPGRRVPTVPNGELAPLLSVFRSTVTEVAVHRWDLESAGDGAHAPVATDLAVDLVDSIFGWWAPLLLADRRIGLHLGGTVDLHAVDAGVHWAVSVEGGRLAGGRVPSGAGADAVLAGPAEAVLLALFKRLDLGAPALVVEGDRVLVERFLRIPYVPDPQISAAH
jgi:hypothetical protein